MPGSDLLARVLCVHARPAGARRFTFRYQRMHALPLHPPCRRQQSADLSGVGRRLNEIQMRQQIISAACVCRPLEMNCRPRNSPICSPTCALAGTKRNSELFPEGASLGHTSAVGDSRCRPLADGLSVPDRFSAARRSAGKQLRRSYPPKPARLSAAPDWSRSSPWHCSSRQQFQAIATPPPA